MASAPSPIKRDEWLVTVKKASELIGKTEKAIRRRIESGNWRQGVQYHRAADGSVFIDMKGVARWARGQ